MTPTRTPLIAALLCAIAAAAPAGAASRTPSDLPAAFSAGGDTGVFLIITDVHLDPFADPAIVKALDAAPVERWKGIFESSKRTGFAQYGSDANYPLMMSAIEAARRIEVVYDYILYPGDYLSHGFKEAYDKYAGGDAAAFAAFVEKTVRFVGDALHDAFPGVPILGTLGNNDSICGDYKIAPESPLLAALAPVWGEQAGAPAAFADFPVGGFYAMPHPTVPDREIVVLNDIFWSIKYVDECSADGGDPGAAQLAWLEWTLYRLQQQGRTASLLMHVPPGINAYSSSRGKAACRANVTRFWAQPYAEKFLALARQFRAVLGTAYAGHMHMDDFRVLADAAGDPFLLARVTPAVSPIFGNNPAFALVTYDRKTGGIHDYATFALANLEATGNGKPADWRLEYVFSKAYGLDPVTPQTLAELSRSIASDPAVREKFIRFYTADTAARTQITEENWPAYQCAQTAITAEAYADCYCKTP